MNLSKLAGKQNTGKIVSAALALVLAALAAILPSLEPRVILTGVTIFMYIILAVSWTMFSGSAGYVSLATAAFYGLGVYIAAIFNDQFSLPVLILFGGIAAFVVALGVGAITLRLRGVYFTIFTFGLVELLRELINWLELNITGRRGRLMFTYLSADTVYYYLLGLAVLAIIVAIIIKRSRFGKALTSIGESEDAAAHIGVNTTLVKIIAFGISSAFMGAVGAAMAMRSSYIDSGTAFKALNSFLPVLMVIFGGMDRLAGSVIGAAVFAWLQEYLITSKIFSPYYSVTIGAIMILAILFMPKGLVGLGEKIFNAAKPVIRKTARKEKEKGAGHADT